MNSNQKKQPDEGQRGSPYWGLWSEDSSLRSSNQEVLTKKFFGQVDCVRTRWRYQFVFIELVLDTIQWMPLNTIRFPRESHGGIQSSSSLTPI